LRPERIDAMGREMRIEFQKFHGLGNDFIVADGRGLPGLLPSLARAITSRNTGVGADGFLVVLPPASRAHNARVRFFNADGSEPEMSGNGIRCVGAFLMTKGGTKRGLAIETSAGLKTLRLASSRPGRWIFRVSMGAPILEALHIPFKAGGGRAPVVDFPIRTSRGPVRATVTSMGNPHCSVFVKSFDAFDWPTVGSELERDRHFPNRTNVEFVRVISRRRIEVRYWERGVGITQSSGTGSCGAVVASILNGLTGRQVMVETLAGNLQIEWPEGGEVLLTGPAERIAHGVYFYRGSR
jgi:diaminopimelate epimerase